MKRRELLDTFASGPDLIRAALRDVTPEAFDYKPSPEAWSIREIVHHLPDSEASGYIRCRKIIAESGATVATYDQEKFADRLKYARRDIEDALELFALMRSYTADLLRSVDETVWRDNYIVHPEDGRYTLTRWLEVYARHAEKHAEQIRRNVRDWEQAGRPG